MQIDLSFLKSKDEREQGHLSSGPPEILTRIAGFIVQSDNHYIPLHHKILIFWYRLKKSTQNKHLLKFLLFNRKDIYGGFAL